MAVTNIKSEKEHCDGKPEFGSSADTLKLAQETYWDKVYKRIKEIGITRRDFCKEVGINENSLSGMMHKTPNIVFFKRAAAVLGIDLSYLFDSSISSSSEEHYVLADYEKELILELRKVVRSKREERALGLILLLKYLRDPGSVCVLESRDRSTLSSEVNPEDDAHVASISSTSDAETDKKSVTKAKKKKNSKDIEEDRQPSLFDGLEEI